ncbi:MAG: hypothetical protein ACRDZX_12060 [Acidimicrobiales bacterium]
MLDHLFLDTVGALRTTLDASLLERTGQDDRLVYDLLSGDLVWETSVTLPGDGDPPRVSADLSLDWQIWSQSAWRSLAMGETVEDPPEIGIEIVFRAQRLARRPALGTVLAALPEESPDIGGEPLARSAPVVEESFEEEGGSPEVAVEVAYEGSYRLPPPGPAEDDTGGAGALAGLREPRLSAGGPLGPSLGATRQVSAAIEATLNTLGTWLASTLVRLADLDLDYLPPAEGPDNP